jgi:hypothetical protein
LNWGNVRGRVWRDDWEVAREVWRLAKSQIWQRRIVWNRVGQRADVNERPQFDRSGGVNDLGRAIGQRRSAVDR